MTRLSIRWRLTLWYGVSLAVTLCGFCLLLLLLMRQQVLARTDASLREEVKEIGLEINLAENASAFRTAAEARFTQHAFYEFFVTDDRSRTIFASSELTIPAELIAGRNVESMQVDFTTHQLGGLGPFRIAHASVSSEFGLLDVHAMRSLAPLYADLHALQWAMAGLLPLGVLLSLAAGHFLAGRALSPVQRVVDVANSINISCLNRRIDVLNPHDEIGKLTAALNSFIARLEQAVIEIRRFTADASHEIRTPIASLRVEAEAALRSPRSPEEYARALAVIVDEAARLGRLTDQLLNLSRHDAGIARCTCEAVQLDALLQDVVDQLQPLATNRGVSLHCEINASGEVLGDDIRLSQAFFNVIENAIKYSNCGSRVETHLRFAEKMAVVEVKDSGVGIPSDDLPLIFERFYRVDPSRQSDGGGAGLGLSIAKAAVAAHHGTIDVRSHLGTGTTVIIRLPACISSNSSYSSRVELAQA